MSHNKVEVGRGGPLKRVGEIGWTVSQLDIGLVGRCRSWTLDGLDGVALGGLDGVAVGGSRSWILERVDNIMPS